MVRQNTIRCLKISSKRLLSDVHLVTILCVLLNRRAAQYAHQHHSQNCDANPSLPSSGLHKYWAYQKKRPPLPLYATSQSLNLLVVLICTLYIPCAMSALKVKYISATRTVTARRQELNIWHSSEHSGYCQPQQQLAPALCAVIHSLEAAEHCEK